MQGSTMPANGEYMVTAYIVVAVVILGYSLWLWRQVRKLKGVGER